MFCLFSVKAISLEVFKIDIAPMSAYEALKSLASQTGYEIIFGENATPKNEFQGKRGDFSIVDALDILLGRGDLDYQLVGKQIRITRKTSHRITALPKITVLGYLRDASSRISQNDDSQKAFPLYQIPLSIQSIPEEYIEEVEARSIDDIVSYVSGIEYFELASGIYPQYYSRGIPALFGIDGKFYRRTLFQLDPAVLERVDVIQGPSANYIQPGGMLNLVTKKPESDSAYDVSLMVGSEDYYRNVADLNVAFGQKIKTAVRVIGVAEKQKHFKDFVYKDKYVVAPSVNVDFAQRASLLISAYHQIERKYPHTFTYHDSVLGQKLPEEQIIGTPWSQTTTRDSTFSIDYSMEDWAGWRISSGLNWSYALTDVTAAVLIPIADNGDSTLRYLYAEDNLSKSHGFDAAIEKGFSVLGRPGVFRLGYDYQNFEKVLPGYNILNLINPFNESGQNVYNVYQAEYYDLDEPEIPDLVGNYSQSTKFSGVSVSQALNVTDNLTLHTDFRYEEMDIKAVVIMGMGALRRRLLRNYKEFTPQFGLNFTWSDSLSSHMSYSTSFTNQTALIYDIFRSNLDDETDSLAPIKTRQIEAALKKTWQQGALESSLTFYKLKSSNILMFGGELTTFGSNPADDQRSQGVDLSVSGRLSPPIHLVANWSYNDNNFSVRDAPGSDIGYSFIGSTSNDDKRLHGTAKNSANLWVNYIAQDGRLSDYEFGLGAKYVGKRFGDDSNSFDLPSYVKAEAIMKYHGFSTFSLALSVRNLFDRSYYLSSWGAPFFVEEGEPRSVYLSIKTTGAF